MSPVATGEERPENASERQRADGPAKVVRMLQGGAGSLISPALGMSMSVKLGNTRDLVLQTHVAADAEPTEINRALAGMADAADLVSLRYELAGMRKELKQRHKTTKGLEEDLERISRQQRDRFEDQLRAIAKEMVDVEERDKIARAARGREGTYKPAAPVAQRLATLGKQLETMRAVGYKPSAEDAANIENANVTLTRHREGIAELEADIKEAEAKLAAASG